MSIAAFAAAPEVRVAATHIYLAPVPSGCFKVGEKPHPCEVYSLQVSSTPRRVSVAYRLRVGCRIMCEFDADSQDLLEQFAFAAWRELSGHTIPYAVYSQVNGGMWLKLSTDDEAHAPKTDFRQPELCI